MSSVPGWDGAAFDRWLTSEPDDDSELTDEQVRCRDEADREASRMLDEQAAHEQAQAADDEAYSAYLASLPDEPDDEPGRTTP
jgi:hypothetical protein